MKKPYPNWMRYFEEVPFFRGLLAKKRGEKFLGHRIFYSFESCLAEFDQEEQSILRGKGFEAIDLVMARLSRGNEFGFEKGDIRRIEANFMFRKQKWEDCICRHKARVMAAFLQDLSIPAKLVCFSGIGVDGGWLPHAVVYVFEVEKYADPTNSLPDNHCYMTRDEMVRQWNLNCS